ncbi:MAG: glycoside hydrolase family 78 protein [Candidatus Thorarchaeota archaeon]
MTHSLVINNLRCEYLVNPLGIDVKTPRLSWIIDSDERGQCQTAYRIVASSKKDLLDNNKGDLWDTEKVLSNQTIHISYDGTPLKSKMCCYWKVMVWDKNDIPSEWSQSAMWTMGLLHDSDWKAKWIGLPPIKEPINIEDRERKYYSSPLIRKSFSIEKPIKNAFIYVTALGHYELFLNGKRIGDHILAPEWTDYTKRVQYQTYEVSNFIIKGENVIGAVLGDGWYRGNLGPGSDIPHTCYGENLRLILQMSVELSDGSIKEILSESDWKISKEGPIRMSDHFIGEIYDAQKEKLGWNAPRYNDSNWSNVIVDESINIELVAQLNEPIRIVKEITPVSINEIKPEVFIFDLGQNIAGWCKIRVNSSLCEPDATITLRHAEMLNEDGTLYVDNLRDAKATDKFILNGNDTREFNPHFTYHGFQFVEVTGLKMGVKPDLNFLIGCVISSDCKVVGEFESSDATLNILWNNILWTQRDNLISIPTDCPQRDERMGWMGDAQVFCQTSIYNMGMGAFYTKWIQDIRDCQREDGMFPIYVPYPPVYKEITNEQFGAAAWSDCGLILPWKLYLNYKDKRIINMHYNSAKKFVDFIHSRNKSLLWLRSTGMHYGDWLNGDTIISEDYPRIGATIPFRIFATAYFANSASILSKMASVLGLEEDSIKYSNLAKQIRDKFTKRYVKETGRITGDTQAGYALALHFNLIPEDLRPKLARKMVEGIERYEGRLSTGFCSTLPLMLELTKAGYNEKAYKLMFSRRFPSWFFMIDQGATTMWEHWDSFIKGRGFYDTKMNSFNHYSIGSIGEWIFRVILGINLDENRPGYNHIIIKPMPGDPLTWAKGCYESIHGQIIINWDIENRIFNLEVSIPTNTTATVYLPAESVENTYENEKPIQESKEIKISSYENKTLCLEINSGKYFFKTSYPN